MIALLAAGNALAQDPASLVEPADPRFGAMLELGSLRNSDPTYDLFADTNAIFSWGGRLVVRPAKGLELRLGYQHARHGATVYSGSTTDGYYDYNYYSDSGSFQSAFYGHEATVGLRVDGIIQDTLLPYVALDGTLLAVVARFDDDPLLRDNAGQVSATGFAPGAGLVGGFEVRAPPGNPIQMSLHLELGYTMLARMDLADFGSMEAGGFTIRSGGGVRF